MTCLYFMTGAPEGSTKVFLEKPENETATLCLQGIALQQLPDLHYFQ